MIKLYFSAPKGNCAIMGPYNSVIIDLKQISVQKTGQNDIPIATYMKNVGWVIDSGILKGKIYSSIKIIP